jgi:hypothetical protein
LNQKQEIMKRKLFQFLSLAVILAFMMPVLTHAQTGKVNFAGNWVVNAEKSTQPQQGGQGGGQGGGGNRGLGGPQTVTQDANLLTVETSRTNPQTNEVTKNVMKYTLDGKESINTSARGDSKSVATWSADGKSLTIVTTRTFDMNGETRTMKTTAVWAMDGANLSITTTSPGQSGNPDRVVKAVFDKK